MQTLKAYLYPNVVKVQFPDRDIFTVRNNIVYAHPIKVYQGIDNTIQVILLNQDNKSINLVGNQVWVSIQDSVNKIIVAEYQVQWSDITKGQGTILLDKETLNNLDQRRYKLTIKKVNVLTNSETPAYIDDNYSVQLDIEVFPGYY